MTKGKELDWNNKKEYYAEKLKDVKEIYVVGSHTSTGSKVWNHFTLYYFDEESKRLEKIWFGDGHHNKNTAPTYWRTLKFDEDNTRGGFFQCDAWGTSRPFELVYSLGMFLYYDPEQKNSQYCLEKFRDRLLNE